MKEVETLAHKQPVTSSDKRVTAYKTIKDQKLKKTDSISIQPPLSKRFQYLIALGTILSISFVLRCYKWPQVFWNGKFIPNMPDVYYHLRIIELIFRGHLSSPLFDYYLNYPVGGLVYWPLGFDWLISLIGLPVYLFTHNLHLTNIMMGTAIPLMGLLIVYLMYRVNRRELSNPFLAVILSLFPAASLVLIGDSMIGRIDQQIMEALIYAGVLVLLMKLLESRKKKTAVALGIILGLSLWMWNGSIFHAALVYGAFAVASMNIDSEYILQNWHDTALAAFISGSFVILWYGAVWTHPFSSVYLSFFHMACLLVGVSGPSLIRWGKSLSGRFHIRVIHWIIGGIFLSVLLFLWLSHSSELMAVFLKKDPVAATSMESWSLLKMYGMAHILQQPLIFLSPVCILILAVMIREKRRATLSSALLSLLLITGLTALIQFRFVRYFELTTAVSLAVTIRWGLEKYPARDKLVMILILFFSVLPLYQVFRLSERTQTRFQTMRPVEEAVVWLRTHSPQVSHYLDPGTKPAQGYAVFCPDWAIGHFIIYTGHRPVIASPFGGTPEFAAGSEACVLSMLMTKEDEFYDFCRKHNIRYVLCNSQRVISPANLQLVYKMFTGKSIHYRRNASFYFRLFSWNNWKTEKLNSLTNGFSHFRLIYNSGYIQNGLASVLRIYEVVPGAHVQIHLPLNKHHFVASIAFSPGYGKPILYRMTLQPDSSGHFSFHCPFSTDINGDVKAISKLEIRDMDQHIVIKRVSINDSDVESGKLVPVSCKETGSESATTP